MVFFQGKFDDEFDMLDAVRTKVEESDDEMENLEPKAKRGRGRGSRGNDHLLQYQQFWTTM